jgi:hypothetical protein
MPFVNHRNNSRTNWGRDVDSDTNPSFSDIQLGCLLRIADATELMAKRHTELIAERDRYERYYRQEQDRVIKTEARLRGTRGALTRAQRRIADLQQELAAAKRSGINAPAC